MPRRRPVLLWLLISVALAGCASERVKAEARKAKEANGEYVDYYPTGSNIPIKVRKDQITVSESETARAQEVMRNVQRSGRKDPSDGGGE